MELRTIGGTDVVKDIKPGATFIWGGRVLLVSDEIDESGVIITCIQISTGTLFHLDIETPVTPVKTKLIVHSDWKNLYSEGGD